MNTMIDNTMIDNTTTDTTTDLNLADLPPVAPARYEHLLLVDATHVLPAVPVLPTRRKKNTDWYAGGTIVLLLSALAAAVDLLMHLN